MVPDFARHADHVRHIAMAAVAAADPDRVVRSHLRREGHVLHLPDAIVDLTASRVSLISSGKAAVPMAQAAADLLGDALDGGVVIGKGEGPALPPPLAYYAADHPLPTQRSLDATTAALALAARAGAGDLVLCLVSGGTSALLTKPELPLPAWGALNEALIRSGCTINEINDVRQYFDAVKGGGLARAIAPATCVALILSDVIDNRLEHIGSGPTVPIASDGGQVRSILTQPRVHDRLPPEVRALVDAALSAPSRELAPPVPPPSNHIVGDVSLAAGAAAAAAKELGFAARVASTRLVGEARRLGRLLATRAGELPAGRCLVYGGESTVTVTGSGYGGRNQEMALAAAIALHRSAGRVVACFSTDGDDGTPPPGQPPVAGAFVTGETFALGRAATVDARTCLNNNDSYTFFARVPGTHLFLPAGTNVNDVTVILSYESDPFP